MQTEQPCRNTNFDLFAQQFRGTAIGVVNNARIHGSGFRGPSVCRSSASMPTVSWRVLALLGSCAVCAAVGIPLQQTLAFAVGHFRRTGAVRLTFVVCSDAGREKVANRRFRMTLTNTPLSSLGAISLRIVISIVLV